MKKLFILIAAIALLTGCKEDNWLDWKTQNEIWLQQNLKNDPEVKVTESGLQYKILYMGNPTDVRPNSYSEVLIDYKGRLINGYQFDASQTAQLSLAQTVKGFTEGLKKIYAGGDIILYIPYDLGYGEDGSGTEGGQAFIPPYSTLIFEIHLSAVSN